MTGSCACRGGRAQCQQAQDAGHESYPSPPMAADPAHGSLIDPLRRLIRDGPYHEVQDADGLRVSRPALWLRARARLYRKYRQNDRRKRAYRAGNPCISPRGGPFEAPEALGSANGGRTLAVECSPFAGGRPLRWPQSPPIFSRVASLEGLSLSRLPARAPSVPHHIAITVHSILSMGSQRRNHPLGSNEGDRIMNGPDPSGEMKRREFLGAAAAAAALGGLEATPASGQETEDRCGTPRSMRLNFTSGMHRIADNTIARSPI